MADRPEELYARWARTAPNDVSLGDARRVAERYFPPGTDGYGDPRGIRKGSAHAHVVEHPWLKAHPKFKGGRFNLSEFHGKNTSPAVPRDAIADLVLAIRIVEAGREKGFDENYRLDDQPRRPRR